ncbi:MAG: RidA family protein [Oscillospiraceae bacterium]|nr:RidA family protein [Oscillospiraceae bacterium]MBP1550999.1 RidA family protein [Oscillospiraceae bacterium]MBP1554097.1 RidA family protein [Oscillospiraceae bacterium]MBP1571443.1 RidA family protein [Oscillospiraceae bacterium]MBQ5313052.1 RidA family protein [Oscillospiraceae bacterium]
MNKVIYTDKAPAAIGPYSQAILAGNTLYVSGQLPVNPATGNIDAEDIAGQARQSLTTIKHILEEAGFTLNDVVKTTCLLHDVNDFAGFNAVYAEFFNENKPARACFGGNDLPKGALIEIEVIAVK